MFEDIFDPNIIASRAELISFLRLWGLLFAALFTLRILQRIISWFRRQSAARRARRDARRERRRTKRA